MLQWFHSFLTTCQQRVVINGYHSDWHHVSSGVPQGSILGPPLFILYINDISSVTHIELKIFAYDVTLCTSVKCSNDCLSLKADLDAISRWCRLWQMKLHPSKCEVMSFSNKCSPLKFDYKINDFSLKWCSSVRYLGVHINSKLSWNDLCSVNAAKLKLQESWTSSDATLWLFYYCNTKFRAFRVQVIPILEYTTQVWNPYTKKNIDELEGIQLCGAHCVCGSWYNVTTFAWSKPSVQCRSELNWPLLSIRQDYLSLLTIHDMLYDRSCFNFSMYLLYLPHVPDLILFLYIAHSLTLTPIGIPFLLTME